MVRQAQGSGQAVQQQGGAVGLVLQVSVVLELLG
jgi:hypothetical protein